MIRLANVVPLPLALLGACASARNGYAATVDPAQLGYGISSGAFTPNRSPSPIPSIASAGP
jgi:hypothetical protein